jgi:predicted alpha/beta superfamily hydrolase
MRYWSLLLSVTVWFVGNPAYAEPTASQSNVFEGYYIQHPQLIRGDGLPWEHQIQVALPASYFKESNKSYPVLWVTDGSFRFHWAIETLKLSAITQEMIIVAVGAPPEAVADTSKRRTYDFLPKVDLTKGNDALKKAAEEGRFELHETGGGSDFLSFITGKLRGELQKRYRMSDNDILYGSSRGGMFCVYALFEKPEAFDTYVCNSPPLDVDGGYQFKVEEDFSRSHSDLAVNLFLSAGEGILSVRLRAWRKY